MANVIIEKLGKEEIEKRGISKWPIWTKEVSRFDWFYDSEEHCQIIEGEIVIESEEGNFYINPGDYVVFKKGLKCIWDIKKPVRKHYNFI